MQQGIYILANDHPKVLEDAIALLNSLKRHSPSYPVLMIPYNERYEKALETLHTRFGVELYDNTPVLRELERHTLAIRGKIAPMVRKFSCWFGPFDEFIYIDTDIVVLQDQRDVFELLRDYDIVYCGSGRDLGIKHVFTERVLERRLFSKEEIDDLFNAGFFASKKGILSYPRLMSLLEEAATVSDIFDPRLQDQPLLNYVTLKAIAKRGNIRQLAPAVTADSWAGNPHLSTEGERVYGKGGTPVRHIHWAGYKSIPHRPHVNVWLRYRYPKLPQRLLARAYFWIRTTWGIQFAYNVARQIKHRLL